MATPQTVIHGTASARAVLVPAALAALALLQLWELPRMAAIHGGFAFLGAWSVALLVAGLPLLLLELMLGRRSRRAPLEGLAVLTREADARRGWRFAAWAGAGAVFLVLAALALVAGNNVGMLLQAAGFAGVAKDSIVLPLGGGGLLLLGAGLALLPALWRERVLLAGVGLVGLLLVLAAVQGSGAAGQVYAARALTAADWREAFRLALLGLGGGLGLVWLQGMRLPATAALGRIGFGLLGLQVLTGVLLMLASAPLLLATLASVPGGTTVMVSGLGVWVVLGALLATSALALPLLAEPALLRLAERGMGRLSAVALVFAGALALAEVVGLAGSAAGLLALLTGLYLLLLLAQACLCVFAGWSMKISHARKELALPSEGLYNVWRVAVRLAVPGLILWVLLQPFV